MSKQVNYNENLCAGAAIRDDKGRRISKLFEASHPKMTVGYAKNLIMPSNPEEQEFNFRQSGGGVIEDGVAVIDKVKGNSVVWNQLVNIHSKIDDGEIEQLNFTKGHKYLVFWKQDVDIPSSTRNTLRIDFLYFQRSAENNHPNAGYYNWMFTFEEDSGIHYLAWWVQDCPEGVTPSISNILFYDLTQMFGAGNEPTTYEEFLQRKPKVADEYAYNEGTIVNNKVEAIKTSGVNLWDEQWEQGSIDAQGLPVKSTAAIRSKEFNRCLPNCEICFSCQSAAAKLIYWYDVNKAFISRNEVSNSASIYGVATSPANACFFKVRNDKSTYNNDICINLSDPAINGKYFPYEKHELDLSWVKDIKDAEGVKLFEDGMRSAGTAFDEVRKNKAVKRLGVKVFDGTENFGRYQYSDGFWYFRLDATTLEVKISAKYLCNKYFYKGVGTGLLNEDKTIASFYGPALFLIRDDSFESVDSFKQHLADLYAAGAPLVVYYELAEPIEVEYDEKSLTYPVVAGGTEEAIASEPSSAFRADIGYGIDAVKTILDLKARVEALEGK